MSDLIIPAEGPPRTVHNADLETGIFEDEPGARVNLTFRSDDGDGSPLHIGMTMLGVPNVRAQRAMLLLRGVHVIFTGPVVFYGLDDRTIHDVLEGL
jgi:hypothetical protein